MANRLRELRELRQARSGHPEEWTQEKVAKMIGVNTSTYQSWEVGRYPPKGWRRIRLAEVFGLSVDELGFG